MLVLTRKLQEKIRIGDQITITVLRTKGKAVRLGIEAPSDIAVIRGELTFDGEPQHKPAAAMAATANQTSATLVDCTRGESQAACDTARWPNKRAERATTSLPPGAPPTQVHFERVPRRHLAELLSDSSASAGGPLRAMLNRRAAAT